MKRILLAGAVLALLAPAVYAQSTAPAAPAGAPAATDMTGNAPPPPPPGGPGMRGPGGPGGPGHFGPPPPSRAAHFRLERGDAAIDVKCADDEPMKACSDIALGLMDKLATMPMGTTAPATLAK